MGEERTESTPKHLSSRNSLSRSEAQTLHWQSEIDYTPADSKEAHAPAFIPADSHQLGFLLLRLNVNLKVILPFPFEDDDTFVFQFMIDVVHSKVQIMRACSHSQEHQLHNL